jgi:predicted small metal-binding protein
MKWNYVGRVSALVGLAALAAAYAESAPQKAKSSPPLKRWSCTAECGFTVMSRNETETLEMIQQHQRKQHDTYLTDDETRAQIKTDGIASE